MPSTYITGSSDIKLKLGIYTNKVGEGLNEGQSKACEYLLAKSREIVPVDTGDLYRSGYVTSSGNQYRRTYYVGYSMPYSVFVHEDLTKNHAPGKEAKFLEKPANSPEVRKYMFTIIYREMAKRVNT